MRRVRFIDEWVSAAHCWASQTVAPEARQLPELRGLVPAYGVFEVDVATDRSWIRKNSAQIHRKSCESRYTDSEHALEQLT